MIDTTRIRKRVEVVGSDGHLQGEDQIKLTGTDPAAGGTHRYVSLGNR